MAYDDQNLNPLGSDPSGFDPGDIYVHASKDPFAIRHGEEASITQRLAAGEGDAHIAGVAGVKNPSKKEDVLEQARKSGLRTFVAKSMAAAIGEKLADFENEINGLGRIGERITKANSQILKASESILDLNHQIENVTKYAEQAREAVLGSANNISEACGTAVSFMQEVEADYVTVGLILGDEPMRDYTVMYYHEGYFVRDVSGEFIRLDQNDPQFDSAFRVIEMKLEQGQQIFDATKAGSLQLSDRFNQNREGYEDEIGQRLAGRFGIPDPEVIHHKAAVSIERHQEKFLADLWHERKLLKEQLDELRLHCEELTEEGLIRVQAMEEKFTTLQTDMAEFEDLINEDGELTEYEHMRLAEMQGKLTALRTELDSFKQELAPERQSAGQDTDQELQAPAPKPDELSKLVDRERYTIEQRITQAGGLTEELKAELAEQYNIKGLDRPEFYKLLEKAEQEIEAGASYTPVRDTAAPAIPVLQEEVNPAQSPVAQSPAERHLAQANPLQEALSSFTAGPLSHSPDQKDWLRDNGMPGLKGAFAGASSGDNVKPDNGQIDVKVTPPEAPMTDNNVLHPAPPGPKPPGHSDPDTWI